MGLLSQLDVKRIEAEFSSRKQWFKHQCLWRWTPDGHASRKSKKRELFAGVTFSLAAGTLRSFPGNANSNQLPSTMASFKLCNYFSITLHKADLKLFFMARKLTGSIDTLMQKVKLLYGNFTGSSLYRNLRLYILFSFLLLIGSFSQNH